MAVNDLQKLDVRTFFIFCCTIFLIQLKITQPDGIGVKNICCFPVDPLLFLRKPPVFSAKKGRLTRILQPKKTSMVKFPVKLPSKPALSSHPHQHMNNRNNALVAF